MSPDKEVRDGVQTFCASNRKAWRSWLHKNGLVEKSVWLILYKKDSGKKTVNYVDAVEEALCFGWIDSKANKRDDESFFQLFTKRKPKSGWSRINKNRVEKLMAGGLIMPPGLATIEEAKVNGAWSSLDDIENLTLPADLQKTLSGNKEAAVYFEAFPRSVKRSILEWIQNAKTDETRTKRIAETVLLAEKNLRAAQYKPK